MLSVFSSADQAYTEDDLGWLDLVHCLRDTGMPIADLKRYAELALDEETLAAIAGKLSARERIPETVHEPVASWLAWARERMREPFVGVTTSGDCTACHEKLFPQSRAPLNYKAGMHKPAEAKKTSCAGCHHAGGTSFESKGNCNTCHQKS